MSSGLANMIVCTLLKDCGRSLRNELQEQQELSVEDIARLETQISLLMDLCASNDSAAPIDVVGHVSRDCLALSQRLAL